MSAFSKPVWIEQGPGPLSMPLGTYKHAAGAVQALAVDPINPNRVFVAAVGGGIWFSANAIGAANPTWQPQSDFAPTLTMSAIAMSPLDPDRNTLYAGSGRTTHGSPLVGPGGGPLFGLLKTTDGGAHWNELARSDFEGRFVARILPLAIRTNQGDRVLVATLEGGLHVSDDGGFGWAISPHVSAPVTDVAGERTNATRVYVAAAGHLFVSNDGAATNWRDITPAAWAALPAWTTIRLAVSPGTDPSGSHWIYASASDAAAGSAVMWSPDQGATWYPLGTPPDNMTPGAPMAVSPLRPDTLVLTTNAGSPNHYLAIVSANLATNWERVENDGANNTGPHTDARDMAFALDGTVMFETNDGGISRLENPHNLPDLPERRWTEAIGNLRTAEFHSIAYDSVNHILFGATQDNAIPQQTTPGSIDWQINEDPTRDGFQVAVDETSLPGASIHYSSQQSLFQSRRRTYTSPTTVTSDVPLGLDIEGTHYNQFEGAIRSDGSLGTVRWNQSFALNRADPRRILIGTDYLYESFDRGDNFVSLCGVGKNSKGEPMPINPIGTVTAYAYGHATNANVIWLGAGGMLRLRTGASGLPAVVTTYPGSTPVDVALAAEDWRRAYVVDSDRRVFKTFDGGATVAGWFEITGNLPELTSDLRTIVVMPRDRVDGKEIILVAGHGGVFIAENVGNGRFAMWKKHGTNFPNAVVTQLLYSSVDDVLIAGTFGRSAWSLPGTSNTIRGAPQLTIMSSHQQDCMAGWIEGSTVMFSVKLPYFSPIASPLSYLWIVSGAQLQSPASAPQITVTMPPAGTEVVIMLTVTDSTGYTMVAHVAANTVTAQVASWRARLCALITRIKGEEIFNPHINPLGPDVAHGLTRYERLQRLLGETTEVLAGLADLDRVLTHQPSLSEMSNGRVNYWRKLEASTGRVKVMLGPSDAARQAEAVRDARKGANS